AREQALRASQAKSEFLTHMSHAIRTPFHGMLGMLALLRESRLDARQHELLRTAVDSADHLLGLLNDIVDLSKLEAGTLTLDVHDIELESLLREVERPMRAGAAAKALQLTVEIDPALPRRVRLDGTRLRQVLTNLMANAIRFTQRGSVALACRLVPAAAGAEPGLVLMVSDTGVGMSADTVMRLFERSHLPERGSTHDPMRQGTGLGLEVAYRLVRLMDGDITVDSAPGQGSVFRVALPLRALPESAAREAQLAGASQPTPARARHVLVAEDNAVNRLFLAALLDRMGHSAHFVENGLEALQAVQEHRFDIVLMDVHMPVMDGIAATEAIRQLDAQAAALPIVALTADAYADTRTRCLSAGMDDVLVKPLGLPELEALFRHRFGNSAPRSDDARAGQSIGAGMTLLDPQVLARLVELMPRSEAARLYDSLLTQAGDATERMRRALREADTDELRRVSHGLKGAALNLGLHALAEAAGRLSASATSTSAGQLALALQRFDETLVATRALCATEPELLTTP
ncbi:MAG: response regulator, partial [Burkholderiales bacterium]